MSLFLNVPYTEKDDAKKLGACWDPTRKQWYVSEKYDYPKFQKWFPDDTRIVVCDFLYIIEGIRKCYKCGRNTKVIAFGIENFFEFAGSKNIGTKFSYNEGVIRMIPHIVPFPEKFDESDATKLAKLVLYKIPLIHDVILTEDNTAFQSEDILIKKYGKIVNLEPLSLS